MMRTICRFFPVLLLFLSIGVSAQDAGEKNIVDKARVNMKINNAKQQAEIANYRGAITILREIIAEFPAEPRANYLMAEYFYYLKSYKQAKDFIEIALKSPLDEEPQMYLVAGRIYHSHAELDKAIEYYTRFKTIAKSGDVKRSDVDKWLAESQFAKSQMASPKKVTISLLGDKVNSKYDDYAPAISADGTTLYFTSRRPRNYQGSPIDTKGDFKYYEDIYYTTLDGSSWANAKEIPGNVNTEKYDAVLSLAPAGDEMYIYQNDGSSGGDIFSTRRTDKNKWSAPKILPKPINTSYYEGSISATADGNHVYFISERPKGYGQGDIWRVSKVSKTEWGDPVNLGPALNTPFDEKFVYIHPDGKTLFFASNGHHGMGSYDIYRSILIDGEFTPPVNLGFPVNTVNEESTFSLTPDNKTMFMAAERPEGVGERDIYKYDISLSPITDLVSEDKNKGIVTGSVVNSEARKIPDATIDFFIEETNAKALSVVADADGKYEAKLPIGNTYVLKIIANGYPDATDRIKLKPGVDGKTLLVKNIILNTPAPAPQLKEKKEAKKAQEEEEEEEENPEPEEEDEDDEE